ncbi:MAG: hypothetical protein ACI4KH_03275 [Oscillospiraceae bacterium]
MNINWKQKLTSRKFWVAVVGFVTAILVAFNISDMEIEQIVGIISATSVLIAYIIGEGMVDAARQGEKKDE